MSRTHWVEFPKPVEVTKFPARGEATDPRAIALACADMPRPTFRKQVGEEQFAYLKQIALRYGLVLSDGGICHERDVLMDAEAEE